MTTFQKAISTYLIFTAILLSLFIFFIRPSAAHAASIEYAGITNDGTSNAYIATSWAWVSLTAVQHYGDVYYGEIGTAYLASGCSLGAGSAVASGRTGVNGNYCADAIPSSVTTVHHAIYPATDVADWRAWMTSGGAEPAGRGSNGEIHTYHWIPDQYAWVVQPVEGSNITPDTPYDVTIGWSGTSMFWCGGMEIQYPCNDFTVTTYSDMIWRNDEPAESGTFVHVQSFPAITAGSTCGRVRAVIMEDCDFGSIVYSSDWNEFTVATGTSPLALSCGNGWTPQELWCQGIQGIRDMLVYLFIPDASAVQEKLHGMVYDIQHSFPISYWTETREAVELELSATDTPSITYTEALTGNNGSVTVDFGDHYDIGTTVPAIIYDTVSRIEDIIFWLLVIIAIIFLIP